VKFEREGQSQLSEAVSPPRLGLATKISYGLGSVAQGVGGVALSTTVINYYLIRVVGLRPAVVGLVILISLVIDAVLDPAIGRWSDTFRSRWGRRHPFMYFSAVPISLAIIFLWRQPHGLPTAAMPIYVLVMLVVLRLAGGFYQIPSDALAPELAPDYHERTSLISWRWFFGLFGLVLISGLLNGVFLRRDAAHPLGQNDPAGYANFGIAAAIIVFVSIIVSAAATQRYIPYLKPAPERRQTAGQSIREIVQILSNPSLLALLASGLVGGVAGGIQMSLNGFMSYYFWGLTPQVIFLMTVAAAPAGILGVVAAPILSRLLDKKRTMITVFLMSIFTGVIPVALRLLGLMPPNGSPLIPVILSADLFVAGTLAVVGFVIISSMVADVVEDAAVRTGVRSEGLLFAANGLVPKITGGLGGLAGAMMLEFVHFPVGAQHGVVDIVDPAIMRNLALISLPVGAVLNLIAVGVLSFYRIDRSSHEANLEALRLAASVGGPPTALPTGGTSFGEPFTPPL
jgi:glycoside/pentoside/hexuronide:cation symporter, GPH family